MKKNILFGLLVSLAASPTLTWGFSITDLSDAELSAVNEIELLSTQLADSKIEQLQSLLNVAQNQKTQLEAIQQSDSNKKLGELSSKLNNYQGLTEEEQGQLNTVNEDLAKQLEPFYSRGFCQDSSCPESDELHKKHEDLHQNYMTKAARILEAKQLITIDPEQMQVSDFTSPFSEEIFDAALNFSESLAVSEGVIYEEVLSAGKSGKDLLDASTEHLKEISGLPASHPLFAQLSVSVLIAQNNVLCYKLELLIKALREDATFKNALKQNESQQDMIKEFMKQFLPKEKKSPGEKKNSEPEEVKLLKV